MANKRSELVYAVREGLEKSPLLAKAVLRLLEYQENSLVEDYDIAADMLAVAKIQGERQLLKELKSVFTIKE